MRRGLRYSMGRGLAPGASLAAATALLVAGAVPAASSATVPSARHSAVRSLVARRSDPVITAACRTRTAGTTITLTADCATAVTLTVPGGFTLDGAGHVITAHDPASGAFVGPVLTNAGPDMSITNLTVRGTEFAATCSNPRYGILLANARGSITNVRVLNITQHSSCPLGIAIGITAAAGRRRTVTITGATASGFRRAGLLAEGDATVNVSHSTFGPPDLHVGNPSAVAVQNSVEYGVFAPLNGTGGTFTDNRVIGTAFGSARYASTALLLYDAAHLTVSDNIFSGAGTDAGIGIVGSANITISHNQIGRPGPLPGFEDTYGLGVSSDNASRPETALICNTLAGWKENLENISQPPCIVTETVPGGAVSEKYSAVSTPSRSRPSP
jgi:Right handed beta helix region